MRIPNRTLLKGIKSMMTIVGVILLCCCLVFGYILVLLRDNMLQTGNDLIQYLQHSVDSRLLEIQKYSTVLELHPTNSKLKRAVQPIRYITPEIYRFADQMLDYKVTNRLVDGVFIYYPHANLIVGDLGGYPVNSYYALENRMLVEGYKEWIRTIEGTVNELVLLPNQDIQTLCYVRRMQFEGETVGYVLLQLNIQELLRATNVIVQDNPTRFAFGMVLGGAFFTQTGNTELFNGFESALPAGAEEGYSAETRTAIRYLRPSRFPNLHYVNAYDQREYMRPLIIAIGVSVAGVAACIVFGLAASIYISRQNAKPLRSILTKLGATLEAEQDEYQVLNMRVDQMMREKNISAEKLQRQQAMIGGLFLNMVLTGDFHNEYAIFSTAKRYDVVLENPYYLVTVMDGCGCRSDSAHLDILQWCENAGLDVVVSLQQGRYVLLFNLEEETRQQQLQPVLQLLLSQVFPGCDATAALGCRFDSLVDIPTSYGQALAALRYGSARCPGQVVLYNSQVENAGLPPLEPALGSAGEPLSVAERAQEMINRSFTDPMLGLYMISDALKVSNSYLSTTFKSKFGVGLIQYINQLRIDQAKELICKTDMSIKDIALAVGFASDSSFIRVFKKYELKTPTSLRKRHGAF